MPVLAAGIGISSVPGTGLGPWGPEGRRHSLPWPTVSGAGKGLRLFRSATTTSSLLLMGRLGLEGRMLSPQSPRGVRSSCDPRRPGQSNFHSPALFPRLGLVRPAPLCLSPDRVTLSFHMRKQRSAWGVGVPQLERLQWGGEGHFICTLPLELWGLGHVTNLPDASVSWP